MDMKLSDWIEKYWVHIIMIIGGLNLLYRFVDESQLFHRFPLDFTNDISAYMAQLHFLKVCGFNNFCPYWYNGFVNLVMSQPGWYFFAYPLYLMLGSVTAAAYISMILLFIIAFFAVQYLGKEINLDKTKRIAFYILFFANASVIGGVIRNGRQHFMLNLILLIIFFSIIWSYKDRKLNAFFFTSSVVYSLMLVTHYQETVLAALFFLCLFVYKKSVKEKLIVISSFLLSFLLASWWLIYFVREISTSSLLAFHEGKRVFLFNKEVILTNLLAFIIPITLLIIFYVYYKRKQDERREIIFFLPVIALCILYLTRISTLIPILRNISQVPYMMFFLFFILLIFFKEEKLFMQDRIWKIFIPTGIVLLVVLSVVTNMVHTPFFIQPTPLDDDIIKLFQYVDGRFILIGPLERNGYPMSYSKPLYSYASIYYNLSTPDGWSPPLASLDYQLRLDDFYKHIAKKECDEIRDELRFFNTTNMITMNQRCEMLIKCGFKEIKTVEDVCLYKIE